MQRPRKDADTLRFPHTVMATDTEWQRTSERAEAAGMPISRFICQRAAGPERRVRQEFPTQALMTRLERIETAALVLARRSSGNASPSAARKRAGRRRRAGWRCGCVPNTRSRAMGRRSHDTGRPAQPLL